MTAITHNRKRSRDEEENGSDFMPLSKRITNLHINSNAMSMQNGVSEVTDCNMNLNRHQLPAQHTNQLYFPHNHHPLYHHHPSSECDQFREYSSDQQGGQYHGYVHENRHLSSNGSSQSDVLVNQVEPYQPELNQEQNPYYYDKNKLLYDLYIERMRRQ